MELDDMHAIWQRYDVRLSAALESNRALRQTLTRGTTATVFGRLRRSIACEIAMNAITAFLLGGFAADHRGEAVVVAAAVMLDCFAIALCIAAIVQVVKLAQIDYTRPVFAIAQAFDRIRLLRMRTAVATLAAAPLMWTPLAIVAVRLASRDHADLALGATWIAANIAFGLFVPLVALVVALEFRRRGSVPVWVARTLSLLSGNAVQAAAEHLITLQRYEAGEDCATTPTYYGR